MKLKMSFKISPPRFAYVLILALSLLLTFACKPKPLPEQGADSSLQASTGGVPACTVWPSHFMVTKGNIPVFDSPEDLDKNKDAKYVGKNTPVIRELTVLNEEKDARIMRIVVRGGSLAGEKRRWTLASNLASRTKSVCPENTPRKCTQFAVHFCDESGCRCIDSGAAPDDEVGNMVIEGAVTLGIGPVAFGGKLLLSGLKSVRLVPAAVTSAPTVFQIHQLTLQNMLRARRRWQKQKNSL